MQRFVILQQSRFAPAFRGATFRSRKVSEQMRVLSQRLTNIGRNRTETVWRTGSPLHADFHNMIVCEQCSFQKEAATVRPLGWSWRSGWVILCKECYNAIDYWEETDDGREASYLRYRIQSLPTLMPGPGGFKKGRPPRGIRPGHREI